MSTRVSGVLTRLATVVMAGLLLPAAAGAQSIVDARRVEYTPSADHNTIDAAGTTLVTKYQLEVFAAGGTTVASRADLGKPSPDPDGMIRLDFIALLDVPLVQGVVYETVVSAVGPGGTAAAPRSNTFSFSVSCAPSISPASQSIGAAGGAGTSSVSVAAGCAWTAVSNTAWITVSAGASGTGPGAVSFTSAANTSSASRVGTLTIAGSTFTVNQSAGTCAYALSPGSASVVAAGEMGSVTVTTGVGCAWTASSSASWLTITSGASGTGPGTTAFSAAANTTTTARSATLTIGGKVFTVTQAGQCSYTLSPTSLTVNPTAVTGSIAVTTQAGCAWAPASSVSWITISAGGTGSGSASYSVAANSGASRTGIITIAGKTSTLVQSAAPPSIPSPPSNVRIIR